MNNFEKFINDVNSILNPQDSNRLIDEAAKHELLAKYLFNKDQSGWSFLRFFQRSHDLEINAVFGEKLVNLLIDILIKILVHLKKLPDSRYGLSSLQNFPTESAFSPSNNIPISLQSYDEGSTFLLFLICLEIYLRFNDGTNTSPLQSTNTILNDLCDIIFNKYEYQCENDAINTKLLYAKFLGKLFRLNFINLNKKSVKSNNFSGRQYSNTAQNTVLTSKINNLFLKQFNVITENLTLSNENSNAIKLEFLEVCINYLYEFSLFSNISTRFTSTQASASETAHNSHLVLNVNSKTSLAFESLKTLLEQTNEFLFKNINLLDFNENKLSDDSKSSNDSAAELISDSLPTNDLTYWKKLTHLLVDMKQFKNNYDHIETCLRTKHVFNLCKLSLNEIESKHNNISNLKSSEECLFAKIGLKILDMLVQKGLGETLGYHFVILLEKIGLCTCLNFDTVLNLIEKETILQNEDLLNSVVFEFILSLFKYKNESSESRFKDDTLEEFTLMSGVDSRRRSVFFDCPQNSSLNQSEEYTSVFDKFSALISNFDRQSAVLCKFLNSSLKKYTKFIQKSSIFLTLSSPISSSRNSGIESAGLTISLNQSVLYKQFIYEIIYLYNRILGKIAEHLQENPFKLEIFNSICLFFNEFFLLSNNGFSDSSHFDVQDFDELDTSLSTNHDKVLKSAGNEKNILSRRISPTDSINSASTNSNSSNTSIQFEMRLDRNFFDFMESNLYKIYDLVNKISIDFQMNQYTSILISSQLILFKYQQYQKFLIYQSEEESAGEQHGDEKKRNQDLLCKSLIEIIKNNSNLLDNDLIVGILLELYMKCSTFRSTLNELQNFDSNLVDLLGKAFDNKQNFNYLEVLLDLLFVFTYFNRKVYII
jgi:hypothetical protein